jgi:ligand-binding sensor domain-containing protein
MHNRIFSGSTILLFFLLIFLWSTRLTAQSYDFSNFSLKEGLIQSQVLTIYQAKDRSLWIGTNGGLNNYDGIEFVPYSKADGLVSNTITSIVQDKQGQIIVGTDKGISIVKNRNVRTILLGHAIYMLKIDQQGIVWGISAKRLFKLVKEKMVFVDVNHKYITNISENRGGELFVVAYGSGIYRLANKRWTLAIKFTEQIAKAQIVKFIFDKDDPNKIYLATHENGIFVYDGKIFKTFYNNKDFRCYAIEQDEDGNIWIGIESGAVLVKKNEILHFNSSNGLSDNLVRALFKDAENNIWISSFTKGIFKYEGDAFVRYNQFKNLKLDYVVSSLAADRNDDLFIGTYDKGLLRYDGEKVEFLKKSEFWGKYIYFLYADQEKNIWFSVHGSGIWKTDGKNFKLIYKANQLNFNAMAKGYDNDVWITTPMSLIYIKGNQREEITGFGGYASSLYIMSKDSVLVGTSSGLFLIRNKVVDRKFEIKSLKGANVLSIIRKNGNLIFGTLGDGMVTLDLKTKAIKKYTSAQGLHSNDVYSLTFDNHHNYGWAQVVVLILLVMMSLSRNTEYVKQVCQ